MHILYIFPDNLVALLIDFNPKTMCYLFSPTNHSTIYFDLDYTIYSVNVHVLINQANPSDF